MRPIDAKLKDCAKRACDIVNAYYTTVEWVDLKDKFVAIRLEDGGSDGVLYDNKRDAVRHQRNEQQCAYVCFRNLGPTGARPREMAIYLQYNREAYDNGFRLTDPDDSRGGPQLLPTANLADTFRRRVSPFLIDDLEIQWAKEQLGLV